MLPRLVVSFLHSGYARIKVCTSSARHSPTASSLLSHSLLTAINPFHTLYGRAHKFICLSLYLLL